MADLIDRDALLTGAEIAPMYAVEAMVCYSLIKSAPAVNRWIPCIQRLPEPLQTVIVCTDINTVTVAWINGDHWTFADTGNGHTENWSFADVKYWMHLPEPPKRGTENGTT